MPDVPQHELSTVRTERPGPSAGLPDQIGHYRFIRRIGQGAMGSVFEAEQEKPKRTVALKVISAGVASAQMLRRFELEAQLHVGPAMTRESLDFEDSCIVVREKRAWPRQLFRSGARPRN